MRSSLAPRRTARAAWLAAALLACDARAGGLLLYEVGTAGEYLYGGNLATNVSGRPVAIGGRGNLVGSFDNVGSLFLGADFNWKLQPRRRGDRAAMPG